MTYRTDTMTVAVHPLDVNREGRAERLEIEVALPPEAWRYAVVSWIQVGSRQVPGHDPRQGRGSGARGPLPFRAEVAGQVLDRTGVRFVFAGDEAPETWTDRSWDLLVYATPRPPRDPHGPWFPARQWTWRHAPLPPGRRAPSPVGVEGAR